MTNEKLFRGIAGLFFLVLVVASSTPFFEFRVLDFSQPFHVCAAQRTRLLEAIRKFNQDFPPGISRLGPAELALLKSKGYLDASFGCPGDLVPRLGSGFLQARLEALVINLGINISTKVPVPGGEYTGVDLATTGRVTCSLHKVP
ncbi:MAG TPA: hypothetical protein PKO06_10595 [Candidatus Ozemobacteraceae bacterium]|nr:hypothetical protein [Candidatus Ozemobacteraceae bacterium]